MALDTRDSPLVPPDEVPAWVSGNILTIKIGAFFTTLVVYDAGECSDYKSRSVNLIPPVQSSLWIRR